jgi:hypothetical protein
VETRCPLSGDPLQLHVGTNGPSPDTKGVIHFAVPAAQWWDNIGFT